MKGLFQIDEILHQIRCQQVAALDLVCRVDLENLLEDRVFQHGARHALGAAEPIEETGIPRDQGAAIEAFGKFKAQALPVEDSDPARLGPSFGIARRPALFQMRLEQFESHAIAPAGQQVFIIGPVPARHQADIMMLVDRLDRSRLGREIQPELANHRQDDQILGFLAEPAHIPPAPEHVPQTDNHGDDRRERMTDEERAGQPAQDGHRYADIACLPRFCDGDLALGFAGQQGRANLILEEAREIPELIGEIPQCLLDIRVNRLLRRGWIGRGHVLSHLGRPLKNRPPQLSLDSVTGKTCIRYPRRRGSASFSKTHASLCPKL